MDNPNGIKAGKFPLDIAVTCGGESILADAAPKSYQYEKEEGVSVTITKEDVARLFTISEAGSAPSCYNTIYKVCSD